MLIVVGKQAFRMMALMPSSLFLPKISMASTNIRSHINNLLIAPPGCGKSTLAKCFARLCYHPLVRRTITEADLIETASSLKWISLIIEDLSQTADAGYSVIKTIEGIIGDEESVSKSTMRTEYTDPVKGIGFLCVTPFDLEKFVNELQAGLLSRCTITLVRLTHEDYKKIAEFVNLRAGDSEYSKDMELIQSVIEDYYLELRNIQQGEHEKYLIEKFGKEHNMKIINPIKGYNIKKEFKEELLRKWNRISENLLENGQHPNVRDMQEYYRILINLAFLNIHNRKHENGILVPNESDHKIALEMCLENMKYKWAIPLALKVNQGIKSLNALENIMNDGLPKVVKDVLKNISPYSRQIKDFRE